MYLIWHYYKVHFLKVYLSVLRNTHESLLSLSTLQLPFISVLLCYLQVFC